MMPSNRLPGALITNAIAMQMMNSTTSLRSPRPAIHQLMPNQDVPGAQIPNAVAS
jgi:hypothetical protein